MFNEDTFLANFKVKGKRVESAYIYLNRIFPSWLKITIWENATKEIQRFTLEKIISLCTKHDPTVCITHKSKQFKTPFLPLLLSLSLSFSAISPQGKLVYLNLRFHFIEYCFIHKKVLSFRTAHGATRRDEAVYQPAALYRCTKALFFHPLDPIEFYIRFSTQSSPFFNEQIPFSPFFSPSSFFFFLPRLRCAQFWRFKLSDCV